MSVRDAIRSELRTLRRLPGELDESKMLEAPVLLKGLGGGNADIALSRLLLFSRHQSDDRDIIAALATMGHRNDRESVQERLDDYSLVHGFDARTIRRWSDRGIDKLAQLILTNSPWVDPRIALDVELREESSRFRVRFEVPAIIGMRLPTMRVNDSDYALSFSRLKSSEQQINYSTSWHETALKHEQTAVKFTLECRGEMVPTYVLNSTVETSDVTITSYLSLYRLVVKARRSAN
jgi:hypothetical protein